MADHPAPLALATVENKNLVVEVSVEQMRESSLAYRLRDEMIAHVEQSKPANIVIDLGKVGFVGSVGFLAFLGVRRHLGSGRIVLCNLSKPIRDMFAVCRLIPTEANSAAPFEIAATREEALLRLSATTA